MKQAAIRMLVLILLLTAVAAAQDVASFEKRTTVKTLPNGLTVVILERPEAPVFSFFTHVDAGSVQDPMGKTGLAHMFEHMAFKGTDKIGTTDYPAEKAALAKVEDAYAAYIAERDKRIGRDENKLKQLEQAWKDAVAEAQKYVKPNEFGEIVEREGGEGMNANTSDDETNYFYSFPSNRLELWAYLESERFLHPVMREFYKERDVVIEERRMRTDSSPVGRLVEQFINASFQAHPYHRPDRRLDVRPQLLLRHRRPEVLRSVLHPLEHGGRRGRRRESLRGHSHHREVFRPLAHQADARRTHHD